MEEDFSGLEVRQWHEHSLVTELYKIDVENKTRQQVKVRIGVEAADEAPNCALPVSNFQNCVLANGVSSKPVTAIITKIDPSKPLGSLKLTVSAQRISSNTIGGIGSGSSRLDPTYTAAYRDVVNQISRGVDDSKSTNGFFVSQGNLGDDD